MKKFLVLIPNDQELLTLCKEYSASYEVDYFKYIINFILNKLSFHIEQENREGVKTVKVLNKFIAISSKRDALLRYNLHKRHIDFLCSNELNIKLRQSRTKYSSRDISILYRRDYIKGIRPFAYRINPRFLKKEVKVDFIDNNRLINGIKDQLTNINTVLKSGKYKFLKKYFNPTLLKIEVDKAVLLCNSRYKVHKNYGKYLNELVQITDLYNGCYRVYYKSDKDGRIHSNITRLPKVYRKYLTYNGQYLSEVDLSNSIVYFLSMLVSSKISFEYLEENPQLLMFYKSLQSIDNLEVKLIEELSIRGNFYDSFIGSFEEKFDQDYFKNFFEYEYEKEYLGDEEQKRKVVKKKILAMIFAKPEEYLEEQNVFGIKFPNLLLKINEFKSSNGYKKISHILLQFESYYILDVLARRFNKMYYRTAPIFTLHDCLITTKDHVHNLKALMINELTSSFGVPPKLESKDWN